MITRASIVFKIYDLTVFVRHFYCFLNSTLRVSTKNRETQTSNIEINPQKLRFRKYLITIISYLVGFRFFGLSVVNIRRKQ